MMFAFVSLILIIGEIKVGYGFNISQESPSFPTSYPIGEPDYIRKSEFDRNPLEGSVMWINLPSTTGIGGMDGDPSGGGMGEIDLPNGNDLEGDPSGPGVAEDPITDGVILLVIFSLGYIFFKKAIIKLN